MRGLMKLLALGAVLAGTSVVSLPNTAAAQSPQFCRSQASQIVRHLNTATRRGCNVRTARSYRYHYSNCLRRSVGQTRRLVNGWARYARTCRGRTGFCTREYRPVCGIRNGRQRTYSNACVARRAGARIIGQGQCRVGVNQGQFCQAQASRYINAVNRARAKRCNLRNAVSRARYYQNCLRSNRNATRNLTSRWVRYAQTCRGAQAACPTIYQPVCGIRNGRRSTYSNACVARRAGARIIARGQCRTQVQCPAVYRPVCGIRNGRRQTYSNACVARRSGARVVAQGQCRAGGDRACALYVKQALSIVRAIRQKGCRAPGGYFYSSNPNTQRQVCQQRTPNERAGVLNSMRGLLERCQPQ